jgi:hypothetical protein
MKKQPVQNKTDKQICNWLTTSTGWQIKVNVKIKCTVYPKTGHGSPEDEYRHSSTLSPNSGLDGVGGQQYTPVALTRGKRPGRTRLAVPQGRSGRVRKILPTPRFDPRTVKPVASRYTDYTTPAHKLHNYTYTGRKKVSRHTSFAKSSRLLLITSK